VILIIIFWLYGIVPPPVCVWYVACLFLNFSVIILTCSCFLLLAWKIALQFVPPMNGWSVNFLSLSMHFYNIYSLKDGCEMMNWVENGCLIQVYHCLLGADLCVLLVIALLQTMCSGVVIVLVCSFAACWFRLLLF
jgi:hypothetical protein